jgi:hypothetical protein
MIVLSQVSLAESQFDVTCTYGTKSYYCNPKNPTCEYNGTYTSGLSWKFTINQDKGVALIEGDDVAYPYVQYGKTINFAIPYENEDGNSIIGSNNYEINFETNEFRLSQMHGNWPPKLELAIIRIGSGRCI